MIALLVPFALSEVEGRSQALRASTSLSTNGYHAEPGR